MNNIQSKQFAHFSLASAVCLAVLLSTLGATARSEKSVGREIPIDANYTGLNFLRTGLRSARLASAKEPTIVADQFNLFYANPIKDKTAATVTVDCNKGESINQALTKNPTVLNLTVEISGLCQENVVVTRDHVTLHGNDPVNDGIEALVNTEISDAALWIRQAQLVTVENLKLTGGYTGLLATNVSLANLRVINCHLDGNGAYGVQLQSSLIQATNSTFSSNGNINAGVFSGSRLECTGCTFADPQGVGPVGTTRANVLAFGANRVLLTQCTLTNGGVTSDDSLILATDSTIAAFVPGGASISSFGSSAIALTRVQITGSMSFSQGSNVQLLGVTQLVPGLNQVDDSAYVRIGDASPATGGPPSIPSMVRGFSLRNFAKATLLQTSEINGNLSCTQGADAFCTTPGKVSGTSSCGLCPKP